MIQVIIELCFICVIKVQKQYGHVVQREKGNRIIFYH